MILLTSSVILAGTWNRTTDKTHLSRYRVEEIYVHLGDSGTTDPDDCVDAEEVSGAAVTCTIALQPDTARNLIYQIRDEDVGTTTALSAIFTVTGKDQFGDPATEVTTVSNDTPTTITYSTGTQPFATITSVTAACTSYATTGTSDTLNLGFGSAIGVPIPLDSASDVVKATFNGVDETVGTVNVQYHTYNPTGTLDGTDTIRLWIHSLYRKLNP